MVAHEARNLLLNAQAQLRSALMREESRFDMREDFPYIDNTNWLKWVQLRKGEKGPVIFTRDLPHNGITPEKGKSLGPIWRAIEKTGLIRLEKNRVEWA